MVTWEPNSAARATAPCVVGGVATTGCFVIPSGSTTITQTNYQVNLLDPGDLYGPGYTLIDLKLAKNIRFSGKRLNIGVDIYNLFNNDAIRGYQDTYPADGNGVAWGTPTTLLSPRFARLQVNFDF
jgi:outer membrane receptor protein involved in Fe transport